MPKLSAAVKTARSIFGAIVDETMEIFNSLKGIASPAERKKFEDEVKTEIGLPTTKAGRPTLPKEIRNNPEAIAKVAAKISTINSSPATAERMKRATLADVAYYMLSARPRRIRQINNMLRDIRAVFGVSSPQARDAYYEVKNALGDEAMTLGGNVSEAKTRKVDPNLLEKVYFDTPTAKSLWDEAWEELFEESTLSKKDKKELQQSNWKSPTLRKAVARYAVVSKASEDDYQEVLDAFYETKPEDQTTASYADYSDILHKLSHPGRQLSDTELATNIDEITQYLAGGITGI